MSSDATGDDGLPRFDRRFFEARKTFTTIGSGALGGEASGWLRARPAGHFARQVETPGLPLARVAGRRGRGVVLRGTGGDA